VEELLEIFHRRRQYHLIVRTCRHLENRNSNELTDDMGINSDKMPSHSGLKHHPSIIILDHLKVGIEKFDQPGIDNTCAAVKIPQMISLDSVKNAIQRCHHNVRVDHISLGNDWAVHDFDSDSCPISLCPLENSTLWTAYRHDSTKETNKICQE
jgi:hypothetical protein